MELDGNKRVFHRLGGGGASAIPDQTKQQKVCFHWRAGRCTRVTCPYLHHELPGSQPVNGSSAGAPKRFADDTLPFQRRGASKFSGGSNTWGRVPGGNSVIKKAEKVCNYWMQGNCNYGDKCRFLHSWSMGGCFSMLTTLEGHQKAVTGIAFPTGSSQLYSGSKDETVRIWDCQSGQCAGVSSVGGEVGCMLSEGPWVFVGVPNEIKVRNTQDNADFILTGPVGQVYAMVVGNGLLFAGIQDGSILAWKFNIATKCFEPAASLPGHTFPVVSLIVGANRLYSGSMDNTIRVWNLESLQCMQILTDHTSVVMSVLCWDQFLLSCSLDKTIKVWVANDSGNLEVTYTHNEEHGLLSLRGMHDPEGKPMLLCSCNDNCLRVFDLPSFSERGKIFAKQEIRAIEMGPAGLFFTGDGTGQVRVWKWLESPAQQQ